MRFRFPRLRPRFSLRTLLLAALAAGFGYSLWWNWAPWVPSLVVQHGVLDVQAWFSFDDAMLGTSTNLPRENKFHSVRLWDASTGEEIVIDQMRNCCSYN